MKLLMLGLLFAGFTFAADNRVFELRIYTVNDGKLEALKARFRDHTAALFKKHHIEVVAFWTPQSDDPKAKNTFIYVLAHPSRAAADKNWADFQADPEWIKVKTESEKGGALASKIDRTFMDPTAFSPMK